jgi:multimeric flavodoxin WrbA
MMKVLGICGSLREDSNTNKLVKKIAKSSGVEYELIYLAEHIIKPCTGCSMCIMNEGECVLPDDMHAIYEKMLAADSMIIGAPTYFFDISGAVKTFIDRMMAIFFRDIGPNFHTNMPWHGKRPHFGKPCVIITTAAGEGHERALETLKFAMDDCTNMKIVAQLAEAVEMNDVYEMPEVMARAEEAGKKLGQALKG